MNTLAKLVAIALIAQAAACWAEPSGFVKKPGVDGVKLPPEVTTPGVKMPPPVKLHAPSTVVVSVAAGACITPTMVVGNDSPTRRTGPVIVRLLQGEKLIYTTTLGLDLKTQPGLAPGALVTISSPLTSSSTGDYLLTAQEAGSVKKRSYEMKLAAFSIPPCVKP